MTGVLLDTNVISELTKPQRDPGVVAFLEVPQDACLSVVTLHELHYGLERLEDGARRRALAAAVEQLLALYGDRTLPVGPAEARAAAMMRAARAASGRALHLADALIAATALFHGLTLVTRNTADFEGLGIAIHNPWTS